MRSKKILICFFIITLIVFYISNYSTIYTIDDLAYVIGIGFDTTDDNGIIKLSLQVAIPNSHGDNQGSSQSESSIVKTVECNTINDGINLINSYIGKKLSLSYCKVIIFSKDIPSKKIINYTATLLNDVEVRPYCSVLLSKCEASYFLQNSEPLLEKLSSKYYNSTPSPEQTTGFTEHINLVDFYNDYYDTFGDPCAVLGDITSEEDEKGHIENFGIASFHNGMLTGELTGEETIYHLIVTNQLQNTVLSIPNPFNDSEYIALSIDSTHTKSKAKIVNGFPYITCNVKFNTRILSSSINSDYLDKNNLEKIEDYANSFFKVNIENYLYKTSLVLKSDIAKFGKYGVRNFLTWDKWKEYDWLTKYASSTFKVNVDTHLKSSYLVVGIN